MDTVDYAAVTGVEAGAADVMGQLKDAAAEAETHWERAVVFSAIGRTPGLAESGIAVDVLDELLPDAGVVELPCLTHVAGGPFYRFVKRAFDIGACGAALIVLAIPMAVIAVKIKRESPGPVIYA